MHPFQDFCRRILDDIRAAGRYRSFTALRKVATRFPIYVRPDGTEVLI
jgi:5-aminolevulinate synthase